MIAKKYPPEVIKLLAELFTGNQAAYHALLEMNHKELVLLPVYILDEKEKVFDVLKETKHHILAAFVKAVDGERSAIKFLLDSKAAEWAAVAGYVNGDEKALVWLDRNNFPEYAELARRIHERVKKENDDNPFKSIFNPL